MLLERKVLKNPVKLRIIKWILMVEEKRNWMLWVVKELVLEWNNEGPMKEWVIYSWMEVTLTFLGKEGWKSIAKGWVYLASGAPSALSIRWALVSFCRKWRSSPRSQGWWGKEKLERFDPLGAQADKRCTSGDEWPRRRWELWIGGGFIALNLHGSVPCSLSFKVDKTSLLETGKHFDDPLDHNPGQEQPCSK